MSIASLLVVALFSVPYLVGFQTSSDEMTFGGFLFGLEDMHSYIAKMRYGARDGWIFQLVYTSEPHQGGIVFPLHLALGKLAAAVTGEGAQVKASGLIVTYQAVRVLCGLIYLTVLYRFAAEYLEKPSQRRLAWSIAALAGGLGWAPMLVSLARGTPSEVLPVEMYVPEGFSLLILYGLPHLALARSFLLVGWLSLFDALEQLSDQRAVWAGLAWFGMGLIVPFYAALLGVLIAVWLLALWIDRHKLPWRAARLAAIAGTLPVLVLLYNTWIFASDPIFARWSAQNFLPSPPAEGYILAYGLLLLLSAPAGFRLFQQQNRSPHSLLLLTWPLSAAAMVYLPINVQRRLLEGVIVPLSILSAQGLWMLVGEKRGERRFDVRWRLRQVGAGVGLMLLFPSVVLLIVGGVISASNATWPLFHSDEELASLDWLRLHAPEDSIVLATHESSSIIPAYAGVRVYVGHGPETIDGDQKRARVEAFFGGAMSHTERRQLLESGRIDYIWVGPPEHQLECGSRQCFDPRSLSLREVFRQGGYAIYEVEP